MTTLNNITINFSTDRELTADERDALMNRILLEIEEPQTIETNPDSLNFYVDADYRTTILSSSHSVS
jgi:hypothetical protein